MSREVRYLGNNGVMSATLAPFTGENPKCIRNTCMQKPIDIARKTTIYFLNMKHLKCLSWEHDHILYIFQIGKSGLKFTFNL